VGWPQIIFGAALIAALLFLALYYGWRQVVALRRLRLNPDLPGEERRYQHRQAVGRLVNSVLLLVLAALLTGVMVYLEPPTQQLVDQHAAAVAKGEKPPERTPEQRQLVLVWGWWWVAFLVVLLAVVVLAALDLLAIRRWGLRQYRKLQADRRAMIERQAGRLRQERQERNGH
jgi:flagellar biosynthesis/type III secretory pathway M-ring protein FliF/YscJ